MRKIRTVTYNCLCFRKKTPTPKRLLLAIVFSCFALNPVSWPSLVKGEGALALSPSPQVFTCSPPSSLLCLSRFLSHPRTRHTFLLYSTLVNKCRTEEQSPAMWRKEKNLSVNFITRSIVFSDITAVFGCTLALLNRSSLCGRVCALSVFQGRTCAACLFLDQNGCVGHPFTLIASQTWCVDCKY